MLQGMLILLLAAGLAAAFQDAPLVEVESLKTQAASGFTAFRAGSEHTLYLATSNFWDSKSYEVKATSKIHEVIPMRTGNGSMSLAFAELQTHRTKGAMRYDFLSTPGGKELLLSPNFYGCGYIKGPVAKTPGCKSTSVYMWREGKGKFGRVQTLATAGPSAITHFDRSGKSYLMITENLDSAVSIWEDTHAGSPDTVDFKKQFEFSYPGSGCSAIADVGDGNVYLVVGSHYNPNDGNTLSVSPVIRLMSSETPGFVDPEVDEDGNRSIADDDLIQQIVTIAVRDLQFETIAGVHYLMVCQENSPDSYQIESQLLTWSSEKRKFEVFQTFATTGARGAKLFEADGTAWLAIANYGDRKSYDFRQKSTLWRRDTSGHGKFVQVAAVDTWGANSWEHFVISTGGGQDAVDHHFLAVAEEGDIAQIFDGKGFEGYDVGVDDKDFDGAALEAHIKKGQQSRVYRLDLGKAKAIAEAAAPPAPRGNMAVELWEELGRSDPSGRGGKVTAGPADPDGAAGSEELEVDDSHDEL